MAKKKKAAKKKIPSELISPAAISKLVFVVRGERVILDSDLARIYGVETRHLNQQIKRNGVRFGEKYVFQLTKDEFEALKSQSVISNKPGRGGRRTPPWAFSEYGVVMAATVLDSKNAIEASKFVVDVFIDLKRQLIEAAATGLIPTEPTDSPLSRLATMGKGMSEKLQLALNHVLDSVIDSKQNSTVREEAQTIISESIKHLKDRLKKQGLENEEIGARVAKLLAEAEKEKAIAAKTRAETEKLEFATIIKKLRLLMEVHRVMQHDRIDEFLEVLKEMSDE